jgi:hypothetical protein
VESIVEVGFVAATSTTLYWVIGDPVNGKIGTAQVGPEEFWTDVTSDVISWRSDRGSTRGEGPVLRYTEGTCEITLDNYDGRYDPLNLDGPYVIAGVSQVDAMRLVRIRATHNGETWQVFRGYADRWTVEYPGPDRGTCTLTATDAQKVIHRSPRASSAPVGGGELSGARINRILDSIDWPLEDRMIDAGNTTLQATTLEGDAWDEMVLVQDTEAGHLYVDATGKVVFRDRHAVFQDDRSATSQATFGQGGYGGTGDLFEDEFSDEFGGSDEHAFVAVIPASDDDSLTNKVVITRVGGSPQTAQDLDSQARYLPALYERTDLLMQDDDEAALYAGWVLFQGKDTEVRFSQIVLDPRISEDEQWPAVLGRDIGDRVTVVSRQLATTVTQDVLIRGIRHTREPGRRWQTVWDLSAASKYSFWVIGHETNGRLGHVAIAF